MSDHEPFRLILVLAAVLFVPFGLWHRLKSNTGEPLDRGQEGWFIRVGLRLLGLVTLVAFLAYLIQPSWLAWASLPLPALARWTGVGIGLMGGLLFCWTLHCLGRNLTDTVVTRQDHALVVTGVYRWVRHPFYLSAAVATAATSLVAANWFIFATGSLTVLVLAVRCGKEEANLVARFGDDYRNYMKRTGRFLPRF